MLQVPGRQEAADGQILQGLKTGKTAISQQGRAGLRCLTTLEGAELYGGGCEKAANGPRKPPLPFTTSTMQQEASKVLNFSTQKTMRLAQQLYEGVDVKGHGTIGLITYLRTDSTRIADEADAGGKSVYRQTLRRGVRRLTARDAKKDGAKIQDAHEAIRPTDITLTPAMVKDSLAERPVPPVSADLEAVYGQPHVSRPFMRRRP